MTGTQSTFMTARDDVPAPGRGPGLGVRGAQRDRDRLEAGRAYLPDLPPGIPVRFQDAARQLAADVQSLADAAGPAP